jgi:hypothetical protein
MKMAAAKQIIAIASVRANRSTNVSMAWGSTRKRPAEAGLSYKEYNRRPTASHANRGAFGAVCRVVNELAVL